MGAETQRRNESVGTSMCLTHDPSAWLAAQCDPVMTACSAAEVELQLRDPKDGDLLENRTKPEETLVEVRMGSNVQIDPQIFQLGCKAHRAIS